MGIIHRDIKPENILVALGSGDGLENSHVRIADFGNAYMAPGEKISDHTRTLHDARPPKPLDWQRTYTHSYVGTPDFMAPEVRCEDEYGPMVDWWGLGNVAWDMFTAEVRVCRLFLTR